MNVSKLVDEDEPLFLSLINDLFVGLKLTTSTYRELQKAITNVCNEMGLINHPPWNLKIIQVLGIITDNICETGIMKNKLCTSECKFVSECASECNVLVYCNVLVNVLNYIKTQRHVVYLW